MNAMRALLGYPAMVLVALAVSLVGAAHEWGDVTTYAVLAAVGMPVALAFTAWAEAPSLRRSDDEPRP